MNARRARALCPTPSKQSYAEEYLAHEALDNIAHSVDPAVTSTSVPDRAYQCTCGRWHLSSGYNGGITGYYTRRAR